jgi:hypothetical protein
LIFCLCLWAGFFVPTVWVGTITSGVHLIPIAERLKQLVSGRCWCIYKRFSIEIVHFFWAARPSILCRFLNGRVVSMTLWHVRTVQIWIAVLTVGSNFSLCPVRFSLLWCLESIGRAKCA